MLASSATLASAAPSAFAAVTLAMTDGDATPTSTTVAPGQSFQFTLNLVSTSEQSTGLDYYLQDTSYTTQRGPIFRLLDRNTAAATYTDLLHQDTGDNNTMGDITTAGVEDSNWSLLQPRNGFDSTTFLDLGASLSNILQPKGAGTWQVAVYTLSVSASTAPGSYVLQTFSNPGQGYAGAFNSTTGTTPSFDFNGHGTFTVNVVVPEPSGCAVLLAGAALGSRARRHRRRSVRP